MPQVTLSVPQEKLPLLNDVLSALGIENKKISRLLSKPNYTTVSRTEKESANPIYFNNFSWEYFSNELEFE